MRCLYTVSEEVILCEGVARATYGIVAMREDGAVLARLPTLFFVKAYLSERKIPLTNTEKVL